jgi:hypothetical protein
MKLDIEIERDREIRSNDPRNCLDDPVGELALAEELYIRHRMKCHAAGAISLVPAKMRA